MNEKKRARISGEMLNSMVTWTLQDPSSLGKDIQNKLEKEYPKEKQPSLRTVQAYMRRVREEAKDNVQECPWSIGIMARKETGIPWEGIVFLLHVLSEIRKYDGEEPLWPYSAHPLDDFYEGTLHEVMDEMGTERGPERVSVKPLAKRPPSGTVMTVRQAKWLWRLHLVFPDWNIRDQLIELCQRADMYTHHELIADYFKEDFNTGDLDNGLITQLLSKNKPKSDVQQIKKEENNNERPYS